MKVDYPRPPPARILRAFCLWAARIGKCSGPIFLPEYGVRMSALYEKSHPWQRMAFVCVFAGLIYKISTYFTWVDFAGKGCVHD